MLQVKRHWETLIRVVEHGLLELDPDRRILMANARASEILGKKEARLIAETPPSFFPPRDQRVVQELLDEFRKTHLREECRVLVFLNDQEVSLRYSCVVE